MTTNDEQLHIRACLQAIEAQVNWGPAKDWSNSDFEKLAEQIAAATGVQLSVSTLKRLWGKVASTHAPSLTTLHALARYLGYADWRTYQQQFRPPVPAAMEGHQAVNKEVVQDANTGIDPVAETESSPTAADASTATDPSFDNTTTVPTPTRRRQRRRWLVAGITLLLLITIIGIMSVKRLYRPDPSRFSFSANKVVTEGVPNTVIFQYDASAAETDSNYIVQTWDFSRKTHVPKDKHAHSAMYYYPGFFRTKLIVDGQVVKHHDLQITSDGWLGLLENDPVPTYLKNEEYLRGDSIGVDSSVLLRYGVSLYPQAPRLRFFNQRDLDTLMSDRFEFETKVKSNFSQGAGACQFVQVLIQCKDDIMIIPLAAKTCTGDLNLYACGAGARSKDADLSGFGADLHEWVTLHVSSKNRELVFTVNGKEAYRLTFPNDPTGVVGLQYRFPGVGAIKDTWFRDGDRVYDFGTR
ncbi:hypothetical protein [Paraflavitalea pollutisoli]|uniref:hypothetical protein n=1 Tax=Paraflavitalea pollutisoli TaxID=3034143 RepID=UPI0023EBC89D|nr:hypothetical protein [Paraflavitalea sp. H1-2-19X]